MLSDVSRSGAKLTFPGACELPEEFTLLLAASATGTGRRCRLIWQQDCIVGVRFLHKLLKFGGREKIIPLDP